MMTTQFVRRIVAAVGLTLGAFAPAALGVGSADAAQSPTLSLVDLRPGGTQVEVLALSSVPTSVRYSVRRVEAAPTPPPSRGVLGTVGQLPTLGLLDPGTNAPPTRFSTKNPIRVTGLKPDTTYDLSVGATTEAGEQLTAKVRFTTLKQRVRLTLDKITVTDDGDVIGNGEPTWFWQMGWPTGFAKDCFPKKAGKCREGDFGTGTITPRTGEGRSYSYVFAQENFRPMPGTGAGEEDFTTMPTAFTLSVKANESDSIFQSVLDAFFDPYAMLGGSTPTVWQVPQNVERASQQITLGASDGNFSSHMLFTFEVFYDAQTYTPNDGRVFSTAK